MIRFLLVVLLVFPAVHAQRELKYPPKTARTLHSNAEIELARQNMRKHPAAAALAGGIIKAADQWLQWSDEDLRFLLTSHEVPRAFAVSASGCPVCGDKFKTVAADYGWIIDLKQPFKIKCPIDGTVFPSNDYEAYYRSGFQEKGFDSRYADDGWGWTHPDSGEKFWFVAYFNHWAWHKHLVPGLGNLGRAYLLTGEEKYARKAAVMLRRIAEVYPAMDHASQSRYGQLSAARGIDYSGKVVNRIWETGLAKTVAGAYDAIFPILSAEDRAFIDANILEDAIDAYFAGKIRGNFGMHQATLVHLAQIRQTGETDKWFDTLLDESSSTYPTLGLNYALYNLIYRDGHPSESSPGYNSLWVSKLAEYGDLLDRAGRDVLGQPRAKRMFDAIIDQINIGQYTPCIGDTGSFRGDLIGIDAGTFITAYRHYKDPRYLALIAKKSPGDINFKTFDSLFLPPIEVPENASLPPARPRLLDGFGLGILNNPRDTTSVSLYYGQKHGHGHFDRLNFELFANGQVMMPDLGYPDAMNDYVSSIYTWTKNTIAHNTVVVDAQRQAGNYPGEVQLFADSPFARVIDIEAQETYPKCSTYRRAMIMVDVDDDQSYFVDIFTVAGGKQHDYSLHGPPGEFEMIGGAWSEPRKGTLAGENVALGQIYDDPSLNDPKRKTGYASYSGSGFQHLFNVRGLNGNEGWIAQWKHAKDAKAMLRLRILPQTGQQIFLADAHASPARHRETILKYLIARRQGDALASRFVSIIEPFREKPFIKSARLLPLRQGDGVAIEVARVDGSTDSIAWNPSGSRLAFADFESDAQIFIAVRDLQGNTVRTFDAFANAQAPTLISSRPITGVVREVLPMRYAVIANIGQLPAHMPGHQSLVGQVIHFKNAGHRTAHTIASVSPHEEGHVLTFTDDILVGRAKIDAVGADVIETATVMPLAATYRGTTLSDELFRVFAPVKSVARGRIELAQPLPEGHALKAQDKIWLLNVGVGDTIEIPLIRFTDDRPKE